jgi:hypothetical protein
MPCVQRHLTPASRSIEDTTEVAHYLWIGRHRGMRVEVGSLPSA